MENFAGSRLERSISLLPIFHWEVLVTCLPSCKKAEKHSFKMWLVKQARQSKANIAWYHSYVGSLKKIELRETEQNDGCSWLGVGEMERG